MWRTTLQIVMALSVVAIPLFALGPAAPADDLTPERITDAIERILLGTVGVPYDAIDVNVSDGIVTLTGKVENLLSKEMATEVVRSIKGVRALVNNIDVEPAPREDSEIAADIRRALLEDPATEPYEVSVRVLNGVVTLTGAVDSRQEKELSAIVAKRVQGVRALENLIHVRPVEGRPDSEIRADIERMLHWDVRVDDALIAVSVKDGHVSLAGTVPSATEKTQAIVDAWVDGVKSVNADDLEVARWARLDELRGDKYEGLTDAEIEETIRTALSYNVRTKGLPIDVRVDGGLATLHGVVNNLPAKEAASETAQNVVGVRRVMNLLKVRPIEPVTDREIDENVQRVLSTHPLLRPYGLEASVHHGIVELSGTVGSRLLKERAESLAAGVAGVVRVDNRLQISVPTVTKADWEIKEDVERRIFWSPFVNREEIVVWVDSGVVVLTGTVTTPLEKEWATECSLAAGAVEVQNKLEVTTQAS